jgi:hypothetical protein
MGLYSSITANECEEKEDAFYRDLALATAACGL